MNNVHNIKDVPTKVAVLRLPSEIWELDWLYGLTQTSTSFAWGLPEAAISLWAGKPGIGKSRAAIEVAKKVARKGYGVLYCQNEVDLSMFATWIQKDGGTTPNALFVGDSTTIEEQLKDIRAIRPHLVFVDSVNMLQEFRNGSDRSIKRIIDGDSHTEGYRAICKEIGCHIILLSQLTKRGDPRGATTLPHLVDIVFCLEDTLGPGGFTMVAHKNRYGRTGPDYRIWWVHTDKNTYVESNFRLEDKLWCQTTGEPYRDIKSECEAERVKMVAEWNKQFEVKPWWRRILEW